MRRAAWWGGVVAAVALGCSGSGNVQPVPDEPVLLVEETPPQEPAPVFTPPSNVQLPRPTPTFRDEPVVLETPGVESSAAANPEPVLKAEMPQFPPDTATAVSKGSANWTFLTSAQGLPPRIFGVSADEGGNIWVAGGASGVFVMRAGQSSFQGYGTPYPAISIAGGAAGVAYVGYMGLNDCDMAWDTGGTADVYKSGDADRLVLNGSGLSRYHYDIYSGPGVVADEPQGREKLCNIFRIAYDAKTQSVWFGGNHGVAWGDPNSSTVVEHTHPAINGYMRMSDGSLHYTLLSGDYMGLATDAVGNVWIGGRERSALFPYGSNGGNFWTADDAVQAEKIDVWPDAVPVDPNPDQAVLDDTHGFAPMPDGTTWVGSSSRGVALLGADRKVVASYVAPLIDKSVTAMAADGSSMWAGHGGIANKGGLTRLVGTTWMHYSTSALGNWAKSKVADIQVQKNGPGGKRRVLVAFQNGAVGIYSGD